VEICRIDKIEKHPNADKLDIATIKGWNCIVQRDIYKDGDLIIFIPPDCVLPEKLIEQYNLTYLKNGGRVSTTKLRGYISQGLVLDIPQGKQYKLGDDVAADLGITKWEPPAPGFSAQLGKVNRTKRRNAYFEKYTDIENIKNYYNVFEDGEEVVITEKIHGCLESNTMISLADGTKAKIKDIVNNKMNIEVLAMDNNGKIVPTKILNWWNNGKSKGNWKKIKITRNGIGKGNSFGVIKCTDEHKFYNPQLNQYIEAKDLKVGDSVLLKRTDLHLTYIQEQVLIGKILGDGEYGKGSVGFCHKQEHEEYVDYTLNSLGRFAGNKGDWESGYGSEMIRARSKSSYFIEDLLKDWYTTGKKQVPKSIIGKLSPISLAFWYMDDGSITNADCKEQNFVAGIATCSFDDESIDNLIEALKVLGINAIKSNRDYNRLHFHSDEADKLFSLIMPYIPKCMQYKLPEIYRGYEPIYLGEHDKSEYKPDLVEQKIISIEDLEIITTRYDLETELHNYIANDIVVHNCNSRFGKLPIDYTYGNFFTKIWNRIKAKFTGGYEFVYGSHNVQLGSTKKGNLNGTDVWSRIAKRYQLHNIPKNYIVYGEIYGNKIQDLTYGLDDIDLVVFDIKYKGVYISWDEVVAFCNNFGLPTVPVLYTGPWNKEMLTTYTDGKSMLCAEQIREGCVIKPIKETNHGRVGRKILKSVSVNYLTRKGGTEYH